MSKVTARVDVGPAPVDVDWGDGTVARGVHGLLFHDYPPGLTVDVTVTDPASGLRATSTVHVPGNPRPPQLSFEDTSAGGAAAPAAAKTSAAPAVKKSKSEGSTS